MRILLQRVNSDSLCPPNFGASKLTLVFSCPGWGRARKHGHRYFVSFRNGNARAGVTTSARNFLRSGLVDGAQNVSFIPNWICRAPVVRSRSPYLEGRLAERARIGREVPGLAERDAIGMIANPSVPPDFSGASTITARPAENISDRGKTTSCTICSRLRGIRARSSRPVLPSLLGWPALPRSLFQKTRWKRLGRNAHTPRKTLGRQGKPS
jgi:hypothetical protein